MHFTQNLVCGDHDRMKVFSHGIPQVYQLTCWCLYKHSNRTTTNRKQCPDAEFQCQQPNIVETPVLELLTVSYEVLTLDLPLKYSQACVDKPSIAKYWVIAPEWRHAVYSYKCKQQVCNLRYWLLAPSPYSIHTCLSRHGRTSYFKLRSS